MTLAEAFQVIRDLSNGFTVVYDYDTNGNPIYEGNASGLNADTSQAIWWIIKSTWVAASQGGFQCSKRQFSPPSKIWDNRATIFP